MREPEASGAGDAPGESTKGHSGSRIKVDVDVVELRDRAILAAINRNGGLAMVSQLRKALPVGDPASRDDVEADQAVRNSLLRLKAKGKLARTSETWSIVGIRMAASV